MEAEGVNAEWVKHSKTGASILSPPPSPHTRRLEADFPPASTRLKTHFSCSRFRQHKKRDATFCADPTWDNFNSVSTGGEDHVLTAKWTTTFGGQFSRAGQPLLQEQKIELYHAGNLAAPGCHIPCHAHQRSSRCSLGMGTDCAGVGKKARTAKILSQIWGGNNFPLIAFVFLHAKTTTTDRCPAPEGRRRAMVLQRGAGGIQATPRKRAAVPDLIAPAR